MPIGWERGDGTGRQPDGVTPDELAALAGSARWESAVVWTRWRTAADERVCPECGPLDGMTWPADEGPAPPLHNRCRCERGFAFVEWSSRLAGERR